MKTLVFTVAALTAGIRLALAADVAPAEARIAAAGDACPLPRLAQASADPVCVAVDAAVLSIVVFEDGQAVPGADIRIGGRSIGATDAYGSAQLLLPAGRHALSLHRGGREELATELEFSAGESAELIASLQPDAPAQVQYESSADARVVQQAAPETPAGPPGILAGRVVSSEGGAPVANARVFISGTPLDVRTDADGRFSAELPTGTYSISVIAADFDTRSVENVGIAAGETTTRDLEVTPAGLELPEFVVLEPFIEGSLSSLVEERRESAQVLDLLGAEQISRAGDSDAAGALKRVTGLTLVDGKFIYVRGLGERYSSTLLNGAQIPSPDPTRRVVPLDIFPTEVLEGIGVQKTYSADMPGEFAGGTVQLRTRSFPNDFTMKVSASVGYEDGTTGEKGLSYRGGDRDWLGVDDGAREMPRELTQDTPFASLPPAERERVAEQLAGKGYALHERTLDPQGSFAFGIGDSFGGDDVRIGYSASVRHAHEWDNRQEALKSFSIDTNGVVVPTPTTEFTRDRTQREIDNSIYLTLGADLYENHHVGIGLLQLRQSTDDVRFDEGYDTSPTDVIRNYSLEWVENELKVKQFSGNHLFPSLSDLVLDWQYTRSDVSRFEPNTRSYRYDFRPTQQQFVLTRGSNGNSQVTAQLDDAAEEATLAASLPLSLGSDWSLRLNSGYSRLQRDRDSQRRLYRFQIGNGVSRDITQIEELFVPELIGTDPRFVTLVDNTAATDTYIAEQTLEGTYFSTDIVFRDDYRLNLGVRREANDQKVTTFQPFLPGSTPEIGALDTVDYLPAATFTWAYSDAAQFRLGFSKTVSRPDFRELTRSPFTDPITDVTTQGNPDLQQAEITNADLRWEYYFSASELLSVALFLKQFDNPIEVVRVPGTGTLLRPQNAEEATNYGIEIDYYKSLSDLRRWDWFDRSWAVRVPWEDVYVGFNYAWIESEITLGEDIIGSQTTNNRPLQGQSPYVFNFQVGYRDPDGRREATLLYNVFGERIVNVGVRGVPDIYEEPLHQLDFVYRQRFADNWSFRLRLRNLLGADAEITQGGLPYRVYDRGRDVTLSVEWSW